MLQFKAHNVIPHSVGDAKGPPSITVLAAAPAVEPRAIRISPKSWTNSYIRGLPAIIGDPSNPRNFVDNKRSVVTRCLTVAIPNLVNQASSNYTRNNWQYDGGAPYGTDLSSDFLLMTPWDATYSFNNLDVYGSGAAPSLATTGFAPLEDFDDATGANPKRSLFFCYGWLTLTIRGEAKVRDVLSFAVDLYQRQKIITEIELGNELNFYAWNVGPRYPTAPDYRDFAYPPVQIVPMMPDAYASLFHEVCRIASDPEYLVFPTPSGRIPISSGGFSQYMGYNYASTALASLAWNTSYFGSGNPFHPDSGVKPQEGGVLGQGWNPDRRYVWEWLNAYYNNVSSWDGGPAAYPGQYRGQGNGKRPSGIVDDLDGIGFHLYIAGGVTYRGDIGNPIEVLKDNPTLASDAFILLADQFCRLVGDQAYAAPGTTYPAYYHDLACDATEFSFVRMSPNSQLDGPGVVRAAYQNVVDHYKDSQQWPQSRLRRIYHWADDSTKDQVTGKEHWYDNLCNPPPTDGTDPSQYYLNAAQQTLPAPGDYHRSLNFYHAWAY